MNDFPRRIQIQRFVPAERAIYDAVQVVESMGADVRLTRAADLLQRARDAVADFVDGVPSPLTPSLFTRDIAGNYHPYGAMPDTSTAESEQQPMVEQVIDIMGLLKESIDKRKTKAESEQPTRCEAHLDRKGKHPTTDNVYLCDECEIASLRSQLETAQADVRSQLITIRGLTEARLADWADLDTARKALEEKDKALEPFAKIGAMLRAVLPDDCQAVYINGWDEIRIKDLRAAAAARVLQSSPDARET